jgi:hypothetical protein
MRREVPIYSARFAYRDITLEDLKDLGAEVKKRFRANMHCHEVKAVEPQVFDQTFGISWWRFSALYKKYKATFRRYGFYFYPGMRSGAAPITRVQFELHVVMRSKYGDKDDAERAIGLSGLGCYRGDFDEFVRIATHILHLEESLPSGADFEHESIIARWDCAVRDPELRMATEAPIRAKQYDDALRSAVVLVETKLRKKCLGVGAAVPKGKTGKDLAPIAYHPATGCLEAPWPIAAKAAEGAQLLFMGFMQYLRNAFVHNTVVMGTDKSAVFEALACCEFLIKVIDKSVKR